jgi:hypothetical protein
MSREIIRSEPPVVGEGISDSEFNAALDRYLTEGTGETDTYVRMNKKQQHVFQEIKKALKRIKLKNHYV